MRARPDRRWLALAVIAVASAMVVLDTTIVSIALPSAQAELRASDADRQWVVTAYTLTFGGLLLLGGRVSDYLGRKRAFLAGLVGFALASALGGAAPDFTVVLIARALQGACAALLTPTALSLLAVTFTQPRERATAFAVYGSILGSGGAVGLLLGGALTQYLSWRWCLYVNLPIALVAATGGWAVLADGQSQARARFDLPGVVLATGGLVALVYGCSKAVTAGWGSSAVAGLLAASAGLLLAFVLREASAASPLLPLRVVLNRNRGGSNLVLGLGVASMFGSFLLLTYYMQVVLRYTPLQAGLAFLPLTLASQAGSWLIARRLSPLVPPRVIMVPAALVAAAGMGMLSLLQVHSAFPTGILPAEILIGLGISSTMVPAFSTATLRVDPRDAGAASATVSTAQQVGASFGTAVLNTIAAGATAGYLAAAHSSHVDVTEALVHGYTTATEWGAGLLVLVAVVAATLVTAGRPARHQPV